MAGNHGGLYIVSPYQLIINEGNYYLLSYDSKRDALRTYRLDRMKEVKILDAPSEGREKFAEIDMHTYTQRVFSMFGGEQKRVRIRFTNDMLDTVIDRFGTKSGRNISCGRKISFHRFRRRGDQQSVLLMDLWVPQESNHHQPSGSGGRDAEFPFGYCGEI